MSASLYKITDNPFDLTELKQKQSYLFLQPTSTNE